MPLMANETHAELERAKERARQALAEDDAARAALARSQAAVEAALAAVMQAEGDDALAAILDERLAKAGDVV
jgi:hypothetical protein